MDPRHRRALEAILEHCAKVEAYVAAAGPDWQGDDMAVDAIAKRLEETGEQAKLLPPELLVAMPEWTGAASRGCATSWRTTTRLSW